MTVQRRPKGTSQERILVYILRMLLKRSSDDVLDTLWGRLLDVHQFHLTFLSENTIELIYLSTMKQSEAYLEVIRASTMELFSKNN